MTTIKSFIGLAPGRKTNSWLINRWRQKSRAFGVDVIKLFSIDADAQRNKLECLSRVNLGAGAIKRSTQTGSDLPCKFQSEEAQRVQTLQPILIEVRSYLKCGAQEVQVRLGQVRLGQVRLGQVRLGQVRLSQVRLPSLPLQDKVERSNQGMLPEGEGLVPLTSLHQLVQISSFLF